MKKCKWEQFCYEESDGEVFLWVISSVIHMLSSFLVCVILKNNFSLQGRGHVPWLPEIFSKIWNSCYQAWFFSFIRVTNKEYDKVCNDPSRCSFFLKYLCHLRPETEPEMMFSYVVCLQRSVQVIFYIDKLTWILNMHTTSDNVQSVIGPPSRPILLGRSGCGEVTGVGSCKTMQAEASRYF